MTAFPQTGTVISADGIQGQFEAEPSLQGKNNPRVRVRFRNGQQLWVLPEELIPQAEGHYLLPLPLATLTEAAEKNGKEHVIPVMEETLEVQKRQVETGSVRITKTVREHEEIIDEPLLRETVDVQRVAVNRFIEASVAVRFENDTMVMPVVEEVLVVEKRLLLKEELHIRRHQTTIHQPQTVVRRNEEVLVERSQHPKSKEAGDESCK
jgi:uncharacterized protein (TIGR02271 family)